MCPAMGSRRVEGVAAGPHAVEQTRRGRRKTTGAKRQMSKNGGRGTGFTGKISAKCCQRARRLRARRAGGSGTTGGGISIGSSAPPGKRSGFPLSGPCDTNNLGCRVSGAGSMGVKSSRMALRLLRATAAPASTTSLPSIFLGRSRRLGPRQNLGQKTKMLRRATGGSARVEIFTR